MEMKWTSIIDGEFEVGGVDPSEFPEPYKPNQCSDCEHWKEGVDSYGDPWAQCELIVDPPFLFSSEQYFKCPLNG